MNYIISKVFIPYDTISRYYPIIKKHPVLTPFMHIRRWLKLIFKGIPDETVSELKFSQNVSNEEAKGMATLLKELGIK